MGNNNNLVDVFKEKYQGKKENSDVSPKKKSVSYKAKKALYTLLTAGALTMTACSNNNPGKNPVTTPGVENPVTTPGVENPGTTPGGVIINGELVEPVFYSVPEPFRTLEEIKAAGEEVTIEEVQNAYANFAHSVALSMFKDEDKELVYQHLTSKFISITPNSYRVKYNKNDPYEDYQVPFFFMREDGRYELEFNFAFSVDGIPLDYTATIYLSGEEFTLILDDLGFEKVIPDEEMLDKLKFPLPFRELVLGKTVFLNNDTGITENFIYEQLSGPENLEKRERVISYFENILNNLDSIRAYNDEPTM